MYFVKAFFAYLFIALVLLQTLSREVLLVDFALHRTELAARYCVNKARPQLHCDGKCYFAKLSKKQEQRENKSAGPSKERLEMLPLVSSSFVPLAPAAYPAASCYGAAVVPATPNLELQSIFRPPQRA